MAGIGTTMSWVFRVVDQGASGAVRRFSGSMDKTTTAGAAAAASTAAFGSQIRFLGMQSMFTAGALFGLGSVAVRSAANFGKFELALKSTQLVTQSNADQMKRLRTNVEALAGGTEFKPTELMESVRLLGQAGFSAHETQIALEAMTTAASAGMLQLKDATELTINVMRGFNVPVEDIASSMDKLVRVTQLTPLSMQEMGNALGFASASANAMDQSLESTIVTLGLLKPITKTASKAGTAMRSALQAVFKPSGLKALTKMGISVVDAFGGTRDLPFIVLDVIKQVDKLGAAEQKATLARMFGIRGMQVYAAVQQAQTKGTGEMAGMTLRGEAAVKQLFKQVKNADGTSAKFAETIRQTYIKSLEKAAATTEELSLAIGEGLVPAGTAMANAWTGAGQSLLEGDRIVRDLTKSLLGLDISPMLLGILVPAVGVLVAIGRLAIKIGAGLAGVMSANAAAMAATAASANAAAAGISRVNVAMAQSVALRQQAMLAAGVPVPLLAARPAPINRGRMLPAGPPAPLQITGRTLAVHQPRGPTGMVPFGPTGVAAGRRGASSRMSHVFRVADKPVGRFAGVMGKAAKKVGGAATKLKGAFTGVMGGLGKMGGGLAKGWGMLDPFTKGIIAATAMIEIWTFAIGRISETMAMLNDQEEDRLNRAKSQAEQLGVVWTALTKVFQARERGEKVARLDSETMKRLEGLGFGTAFNDLIDPVMSGLITREQALERLIKANQARIHQTIKDEDDRNKLIQQNQKFLDMTRRQVIRERLATKGVGPTGLVPVVPILDPRNQETLMGFLDAASELGRGYDRQDLQKAIEFGQYWGSWAGVVSGEEAAINVAESLKEWRLAMATDDPGPLSANKRKRLIDQMRGMGVDIGTDASEEELRKVVKDLAPVIAKVIKASDLLVAKDAPEDLTVAGAMTKVGLTDKELGRVSKHMLVPGEQLEMAKHMAKTAEHSELIHQDLVKMMGTEPIGISRGVHLTEGERTRRALTDMTDPTVAGEELRRRHMGPLVWGLREGASRAEPLTTERDAFKEALPERVARERAMTASEQKKVAERTTEKLIIEFRKHDGEAVAETVIDRMRGKAATTIRSHGDSPVQDIGYVRMGE